MAEEKPTRFEDMIPPMLEVDNWLHMEDILNKDILVIDYQERSGSEGKFLAVECEVEGYEGSCGFACGGEVVMRKIEEAKEKGFLPLLGKIEKVKRYYDIK